MKDVLISFAAFFTTTEADEPDLRVLPCPFTALLLEAEELLRELSFDALPTVFEDPFTSFDVELEEVVCVVPLAVAVSSLGLFSAGGELVAPSLASGEPSLFVFGREEDDWSELHTAEALSLDSGDDSVLRFLWR